MPRRDVRYPQLGLDYSKSSRETGPVADNHGRISIRRSIGNYLRHFDSTAKIFIFVRSSSQAVNAF